MPRTITWSNSRPFVAGPWRESGSVAAQGGRPSASRRSPRKAAGPRGRPPSRGVPLRPARSRSPAHAARTRPMVMSSGSSAAPSLRLARADRRPAVSRAALDARCPERQPRRRATTTAGSSSRFVLASTAWVDPSSGQVRIARSRRTVSSEGSGARTRRPVAVGPARIAFANRSPLCSTSRTARSTTRREAVIAFRAEAARVTPTRFSAIARRSARVSP
jgi:hypothetical protein